MLKHMYETPNGKFTWLQCAYFWPIVVLIAWILTNMTPKFLLESVLRWHLSSKDDSSIEATFALLNPQATRAALRLGYTEILTVREMDWTIAEDLAEKMRFYFGASDNWCPPHVAKEIYERLSQYGLRPSVRKCQLGLKHAFVLGQSEEMAEICAKWYLEDTS